MKITDVDFYYFSGTGNTLLVVKKISDVFTAKGITVKLFRIENSKPEYINLDHTIGLASPVAAQSTYPFVWDFINRLPETKGTTIFMVDTMAAFSGGIVGPLRKRLMDKGYSPIGAAEIKMPSNYLVKDINDNKNKIKTIKGLDKANEYSLNLINNNTRWGRVPFLPNVFYYIGTSKYPWNYLRKKLKIESNHTKCIKCGLCSKLCPVSNITMEEYPFFRDKCESCMRCASFCPVQAITVGGKEYVQYHAVDSGELLKNAS